jgi:hypothetical protein
MSQQQGQGLSVKEKYEQIGQDVPLKNGAIGGWFRKPLNNGGTADVFRIHTSSRAIVMKAVAARKNPRQISQAQAQDAFDRYYARTGTIKRGPRKGQPRFASPQGRRSAMTYDLNHSSKNVFRDGRQVQGVISDARYLNNPGAWDFQGVDTGSKVRAPLSPKQRATLAKGQAALKAKRDAWPSRGQSQAGGFWW